MRRCAKIAGKKQSKYEYSIKNKMNELQPSLHIERAHKGEKQHQCQVDLNMWKEYNQRML